jgi:hypothetical protein
MANKAYKSAETDLFKLAEGGDDQYVESSVLNLDPIPKKSEKDKLSNSDAQSQPSITTQSPGSSIQPTKPSALLQSRKQRNYIETCLLICFSYFL